MPAGNKKDHMLSGLARGKKKGPFSGNEQAATSPSPGKNKVYASHARSKGKHTQPGANAASVRSGKVKR